jgi:hypothetical protein
MNHESTRPLAYARGSETLPSRDREGAVLGASMEILL